MESHKLKLFYAILENAFSSGKMILMVLKVRILVSGFFGWFPKNLPPKNPRFFCDFSAFLAKCHKKMILFRYQ